MIPNHHIYIVPVLACAGWLISSSVYPLSAAAQPADAKAAAEQLFSNAQQLMAKGDYDAACPKLEASQALDAAPGTVINLARCYERQGRLASAWARYREAADLAARAGQQKRQRFAMRQAEALESRLPRLIIRLPSASAIPDLSITRDGSKVDAAMLDTPFYIDPGEHTVVAHARGYLDFTKTFEVTVGQEVVIEVPSLTPAEADNSADADATGTETTSDGEMAQSGSPLRADNSPQSGSVRTRKVRHTIALVTGGAGGLALTLGLGFGWSSRSEWSKAFDGGACQRETLECTLEGQRQAEKAGLHADIATVLSTSGVVLMAAGAILYFTAREPTESASKIGVAPMLAPGSMGVVMTGHF